MRVVAVRVPESILVRLFEALHVWEKLEDGRLAEIGGREPIVETTADWCLGGISYYTRIENPQGVRVARIHYLLCPRHGLVRFPSYLMIGGVRLFRIGHD